MKIDAFLMLLKNELYLERKYNAPHYKRQWQIIVNYFRYELYNSSVLKVVLGILLIFSSGHIAPLKTKVSCKIYVLIITLIWLEFNLMIVYELALFVKWIRNKPKSIFISASQSDILFVTLNFIFWLFKI